MIWETAYSINTNQKYNGAFKVFHPLQDDGSFGCPVPNEEEQGTCDMPECQFTEWGDWGICSGQLCGGTGINARTRDCIPAVSNLNMA